ncbi:TonB-dependent siderophore receptor [Rhodobacter sp. NSM]|uniref:TonB-dependent siderophore receptor n=1 Tax=Rhodobacter sp. NSM TaxID=3457501 RepID=UPI003FD0CEE3
MTQLALPDHPGPFSFLDSTAARRPKRLAFLLACTTLATSGPALAQQEDVRLSPIVVEGLADDDAENIGATSESTGSKMATPVLDTAGSVSVVTQKEIETRKAQNLEQVLSYSAGILVNEWGGDDRYDYFRIRGFGQDTLLTFRDGIPVRGFGWTFGRLEPYGLERVEVLKGSNSALFGLSAPGGVINAVTKVPKAEAFGEAYVTFGEDHAETGTDFGGALDADGRLSYRITAKAQEADGFYDHSQDDRRYLGLALTWAPTDATSLTLLADYNERDGWPGTGFPEGLAEELGYETFLGEPDFNAFDTRERSLGYLFSHDFGNGLTFRQNARYGVLDLDYEQVYGASPDPTVSRSSFDVESTLKQFAVDSQLQYDTSLGATGSRTLLGYEYGRIEVDELVQFGTADPIDILDITYCGRSCVDLFPYIDWVPEQTTSAIYLQQELTFADRWILTLGGRQDWTTVEIDYGAGDYRGPAEIERDFDTFTKRAGLTYRITPDLSVYANYSESFEPDSWAPANEPKEGTQYEAGIKYRPQGMNALFSAAVFDLTQTNVAVAVSPTQTRQIGKVGVRGLELEAKGAITESANLTFAYSYWDASIEEDGTADTVGNRPPRVPQSVASLWADYTFAANEAHNDLTLGAGIRYVGSTYGDDGNSVEIPSYTVVDAMVNYDLTPNVALQANVTNLFDRNYLVTNYYGTEYFGDGRTVSATVRYSW